MMTSAEPVFNDLTNRFYTPEGAAMRDLGSMLRYLRGLGWAVAVHNDYRLAGKAMTFWLFTHANPRTWIKGEAESDELAVKECIEQLGHAA